ncbi:MAG: MgtC/SapB family protein [Alphaproteobacteria bacterium]|nr:MgtC/SapB family protein [Alphaproteobacteria bacterium]
MIDLPPLFDLSSVSLFELILRVFMAMVLGLLLGLDRDYKNKPIDFRAFIIVAVTTCIIAIMGQELYAVLSEEANVVAPLDFAKIIAGVLTGIGFLGAGAIIHRDDNRVIGTATGASIWASGGIGLALGFGFYGLAIVAFVAIAITLVGGGYYMQIFQDKQDKEDIDR